MNHAKVEKKNGIRLWSMSDVCPTGCDVRVWGQMMARRNDTAECVSVDGFTFFHKNCYECEDSLCELCHDWGLIYKNNFYGRLDRVHTVRPYVAKHIVVLSTGSKQFPNLACDTCHRVGLDAVALMWGWDGSVSLTRYRMMRQWNRPSTLSHSEC